MGSLWRIRGEHGWGSLWGLLAVGTAFVLFAALFTSSKKLTLGTVGATAIAFMFTSPTWGTINKQMTGCLFTSEMLASGVPYEDFPKINPLSGAFMMFLTGFGMCTLFAFMLGRIYGGRTYRLRDFLIALAVFFIFGYAARASVAHLILNAIEPQATEFFESGMAQTGVEMSAYKAYMVHFFDSSCAKDFQGGRNYFACVDSISAALRCLAVWVYTRFALKDRRAAKIMLGTALSFGFAITVSDLIMFAGAGGYHMTQFSAPRWLEASAWPLWEYFTGFVAGGSITALLLKTANGSTEPDRLFQSLPQKARGISAFVVTVLASCCASIFRAVAIRTGDKAVPATAAAILLTVGVALLAARKWGISFERADPKKMFSALLAALLVADYAIYFFVGTAEYRHLSSLFSSPADCLMLVGGLMLAATFALWLFACNTKAKTGKISKVRKESMPL